MQGVGIILAIRTKQKIYNLSKIYHAEIFGTRQQKFSNLNSDVKYSEIESDNENVFFVPQSNIGKSEYEQGIKVNDIFKQSVSGIVTMGDDFIINENKDVILARVQKLANGYYSQSILNNEFKLAKTMQILFQTIRKKWNSTKRNWLRLIIVHLMKDGHTLIITSFGVGARK